MNEITNIMQKPIINFIMGLPDSRTVIVDGFTKSGDTKYLWSGNTQLHHSIQGDNFIKTYSSIIWHNDPKRNIKIPHIVVNCICDADICSNSLKRVIDITEGIKKQSPKTYIYNNPRNVLKTTRDAIYQQFHHLEHLLIPKVIKITPASTKEVFEMAAKNKLKFPFLMRPCGSHQSEGLQLIKSKKEENKLHQYAFDGRPYYLTEFVDNKHPDGFYKKARLVIIDGELFARHYMSHSKWLVEGAVHFDYMPQHEDTKIIEKDFLENFKETIGEAAIADLFTIYEEVGLDFLGFDLDIMPNGKLLIFEINLAQNIFLNVNMEHFSYMKDAADKIRNALNKSVLSKLPLS